MDATTHQTRNSKTGGENGGKSAAPVHIKRDGLAESARQSNEVVTSASLVPLMGALHEHLEAERRRNARRMGMLGFAFVIILIVAAAYPIYLGRSLLTRMEAAIAEDQQATRQFTQSVESGLNALTEASAQLRQALQEQTGASGWSNMTAEIRQALEQQAAALRLLAAATTTPAVARAPLAIASATNAPPPAEPVQPADDQVRPAVADPPEPEGSRPHFFLYRWWSEWDDPKSNRKKAPKDDSGL